jgi:hypothetical protein
LQKFQIKGLLTENAADYNSPDLRKGEKS